MGVLAQCLLNFPFIKEFVGTFLNLLEHVVVPGGSVLNLMFVLHLLLDKLGNWLQLLLKLNANIKMAKASVVLILCLFALTHAQFELKPALKITVDSDTLATSLNAILKQYFETFQFSRPSFSQEIGGSFFAGTVNFSNFTITDVTFDTEKTKVTPTTGQEVAVSIGGIKATIKTYFSATTRHGSYASDTVVYLKDASVKGLVTVNSASGKPAFLFVSPPSVSLGYWLDIHTDNGILLKILMVVWKPYIRSHSEAFISHALVQYMTM
jgi:hypothetical protein